MEMKLTETERQLFHGQLEEYARLMQIYRAAIREVQTKLEILDDAFNVEYEHNPIHHIESRLKSPMSVAKKMERKGLPLDMSLIWENIHDIAGIRVICNYLSDVEVMKKLLLEQDDVTLIEEKDYIAEPKDNGYRSLHLVISIPIFLVGGRRETLVEVQLRTIAMDMWASLEHSLYYKADTVIPEDVCRELIACSEELSRIDQKMLDIRHSIRSPKE